MATTPHCSRTRGILGVAGTAHILAVFAADLATCCHIVARSLPFLAVFATQNAKRHVRARRKVA